GYLRLFPLSVIRRMTASVLRQGRPAIFYVHPREIDPDQPRLALNAWRQFKSYVNLGTTEGKLRELLKEYEFVTLEELAEKIYPSIFQPTISQSPIVNAALGHGI
ncbi:MAG: DUF3473 domain-containing protein, partial [Candidatus Binataceae bacterium]